VKSSAHIDIDDISIPVVVHLYHRRCQWARVGGGGNKRRRTSPESVELPHPSMRMRAVLSGRTGRRRCATSSYLLNQSNVASSAPLPMQYRQPQTNSANGRLTARISRPYDTRSFESTSDLTRKGAPVLSSSIFFVFCRERIRHGGFGSSRWALRT